MVWVQYFFFHVLLLRSNDRSIDRSEMCCTSAKTIPSISHMRYSIDECWVHFFFSWLTFSCIIYKYVYNIRYIAYQLQVATCVHRALSLQYWLHSRNTHEDIHILLNWTVFFFFVRFHCVLQSSLLFGTMRVFLWIFWWSFFFLFQLVAISTVALRRCAVRFHFHFCLYLISFEAVFSFIVVVHIRCC